MYSFLDAVYFHFQGEEADDDDIYNVLSTLKRLTSFHKYVYFLVSQIKYHVLFYQLFFEQV